MEGSHAIIGHDLAKRYGENEVIVKSIGAHHGEIDQDSIIAVLVQAADALSAARGPAPGVRLSRRISSDSNNLSASRTNSTAWRNPTPFRQDVKFGSLSIPRKWMTPWPCSWPAMWLAKVESELVYPGQIKVTVVRETRAVETAK